MSGERKLFTQLEETQGEYVTFSSGDTVKILGVRTIVTPDIPRLTEALYVQGFKHNLVSISQICDKRYKLNSIKMDTWLKFTKTSDNSHVIDLHPQEGDTCLKSQKDETNLWHQRLGHFNFRDLPNHSKKGIIKDLLKLSKIDNLVCKDYQMGKQTKVPHKKTTQIGTSRPLELLYMDLADPTRMESLGGRKYFMVVIDDFSRFT